MISFLLLHTAENGCLSVYQITPDNVKLNAGTPAGQSGGRWPGGVPAESRIVSTRVFFYMLCEALNAATLKHPHFFVSHSGFVIKTAHGWWWGRRGSNVVLLRMGISL